MKHKILSLLLFISPMSAMAYWEGEAIQTGPVQVDQFINDQTGKTSVCRLIIGSRGESQKPVIAIFGQRSQGLDKLTIRGTVNNQDADYFLFNFDHGQPYRFGHQDLNRKTLGTADHTLLDELAKAENNIYIEVSPQKEGVKASNYNYLLHSKGLFTESRVKPYVDQFIDCMEGES